MGSRRDLRNEKISRIAHVGACDVGINKYKWRGGIEVIIKVERIGSSSCAEDWRWDNGRRVRRNSDNSQRISSRRYRGRKVRVDMIFPVSGAQQRNKAAVKVREACNLPLGLKRNDWRSFDR